MCQGLKTRQQKLLSCSVRHTKHAPSETEFRTEICKFVQPVGQPCFGKVVLEHNYMHSDRYCPYCSHTKAELSRCNRKYMAYKPTVYVIWLLRKLLPILA